MANSVKRRLANSVLANSVIIAVVHYVVALF